MRVRNSFESSPLTPYQFQLNVIQSFLHCMSRECRRSQKSLPALCHPLHSLCAYVHIFPTTHSTYLLCGVFRWLELVSCLVTQQSSTKTQEYKEANLLPKQLLPWLWLDSLGTSSRTSPSSHGDLSLWGGHSCRHPGRQQDRAHQGRSLLSGHHTQNLRVRLYGQSKSY